MSASLRLSALPLLVCLATPLAADTCDGPIGPIEDCVVGHWIGTSTVPEVIEEMLRELEFSDPVFDDFGRPIAYIIRNDGFFETFPWGADGGAIRDFDGSSTYLDATMTVGTSTGYLSAIGGSMEMCYIFEEGLSGTMTVSNDTGSVDIPLTSLVEGPEYIPEMTFYCEGDRMQIAVELPDPLGTTVYMLDRVPADRFEEMFRERVEEGDIPAE